MNRLLKKMLKEPGIRNHVTRKKAYFFPGKAEVPEKVLDMWVRDYLIHEIARAHMKYALSDIYIEYIDTVHGGNVPPHM